MNGSTSRQLPANGGDRPPSRLTPQEAALRGASLAFQKQLADGGGGGVQIPTGRISRQTTGASSHDPADRERERERQALFLSPSAATDQDKLSSSLGSRASASSAEGKSASFIAATLAASRSVTPSTTVENGVGFTPKKFPLREPLEVYRSSDGRSSGSRVASPTRGVDNDLTDEAPLRPTNSLISMFENQRGVEGDTGRKSPKKVAGKKSKPKPLSLRPQLSPGEETQEPLSGSVESPAKTRLKPIPKPKPLTPGAHKKQTEYPPTEDIGAAGPTKVKLKPSPKPKPTISTRARTPPPVSPKPNRRPESQDLKRDPTPPQPVFRKADTEIVSPKPRRTDTKSRLEAKVAADENSNDSYATKTKAKPKVPKPRIIAPSRDDDRIGPSQPGGQLSQKAVKRSPVVPGPTRAILVKEHQPPPRPSTELAERMPFKIERQGSGTPAQVSKIDGQEDSNVTTRESATDARPSTADSKSSNDTFVSASSVPTRDDTDSMHTIEPPTPTSITPRPRPSRPQSTQSLRMAPPIRRTATGSSQLPIDSLSDAIMAGSLASARHTPLSDSRTPPPVPPTRRKGVVRTKSNSRRQSPHRMKHTLRQPVSLSDDEELRRPRHHHHRKPLNSKKHAHHEGSRSRWREEITEREKKRYEAVWASNRGLFLVPSQLPCSDPDRHPPSHQLADPRQPVRSESYEELSEYVPNVVVRDIWSRSRLPGAELAEVWDLVYAHGRARVHAALDKQEFVVGMWLIDQRLRGRKIPPRVSESVWDSAKGLRVIGPGHGHKDKGKGKGKVR